MKSFFRTLIAVLVAQLLIVLVLGLVLVMKLKGDVKVESGSVLVQTIAGSITDYAPPSAGMPFGSDPETHTSIMENLEKARYDKRIEAVVLRLGSPAIGFAMIDELRERIDQLRESGMPVWAYTETLNGGALALGGACDSLFLMPGGYVSLRGFRAERPFLKGTMDKLGIRPNFHQIEKYKAAGEILRRTEMSPGSRENVDWILDDLYPDMISRIEHDRGLAIGSIESEVLNRGSMTPRDAFETDLVDRLTGFDSVEQSLLKIKGVKEADDGSDEAPARPLTISGAEYAKVSREDAGIDGKKKIAVIHAQGTIWGEKSGTSFPWGMTMGAGTMENAFRQASTDEDVDAIIFRIDSGGGEAGASWRIASAARRASRLKPVVVSMGDVAGSGGYHIAHPCSVLVAGRHSIVGSIGSVSGKFNMRGFYDKIGMTKDFVTRGPRALMESDYFDYTAEEYELFADRHWADYWEWVEQIAIDRGMSASQVDSAGRGRTFTGDQALERGLVDRIGTFDTALQIVKERAGIDPSEKVELVHYPKKLGPLEALRSGGLATFMFAVLRQVVDPLEFEGTWAVTPEYSW